MKYEKGNLIMPNGFQWKGVEFIIERRIGYQVLTSRLIDEAAQPKVTED